MGKDSFKHRRGLFRDTGHRALEQEAREENR